MLTFANPGALDPRAITTFGVNVKEGPTPIGHFGTGLKYAIAVVLRLGGAISVLTEDEAGTKHNYSFVAVPEIIRGKVFYVVHMETIDSQDDKAYTTPLGFTTELGKGWAPWMAYRELRSNMMDEKGAVGARYDAPWTEINVDCPEIEEAHANAGQFFLETASLWANADLEIHPARDDGAVFYRGIRVANIGARKALFTYNILHEERLTEDRTIDLWTCSYCIAAAVALLNDAELAERIILAPSSSFEATLSFDYITAFSDEMREAIRLQKDNKELNASARRRSRALYMGDFAPLALPMTSLQRRKVAQSQELFAAFAIPTAWTDIRLGKMPEDEADTVMLLGTTLWMGSATFDAAAWLLYVLAQRWEGQAWNSLREEAQLLAIMRQAMPELAVFQS